MLVIAANIDNRNRKGNASRKRNARVRFDPRETETVTMPIASRPDMNEDLNNRCERGEK